MVIAILASLAVVLVVVLVITMVVLLRDAGREARERARDFESWRRTRNTKAAIRRTTSKAAARMVGEDPDE